MSDENNDRIQAKLSSIRDSTVENLEKFKSHTKNTIILEKISTVKNKVLSESLDNINDESISRFLVLVKLREEIREALSE